MSGYNSLFDMISEDPMPLHSEEERKSTPTSEPTTTARRSRQRVARPAASSSLIRVKTSQGEEPQVLHRNLDSAPLVKARDINAHPRSVDDATADRDSFAVRGRDRDLSADSDYPYEKRGRKVPVVSHSMERADRTTRGGSKRPRKGATPKPKNGRVSAQRRKSPSVEPKPKPQSPQPVKYTSPLLESDEPIRLNKYLSNSGICSRRVADQYIAAGRVSVNGDIVTELGVQVRPTDQISVDGKPISLESKVYVLLNKPKNCVTTLTDPEGRRTVIDLVRNACPERIYPVGRLDRNTTGVLLLTNDGELGVRLMHPAYRKKKVYEVVLDRPVAIEHMRQIAEGFDLEDGAIHADAISYIQNEDHNRVGIEIHSGRNRIVRRIFEHFGYRVVQLDRVYYAGLTKKDLPRGRWRYLTDQELQYLRMGVKEEEAAGADTKNKSKNIHHTVEQKHILDTPEHEVED